MNKKLYLAMVAAGIVLGIVYFRYGTNYTPPGQPGLVALERTDFQKIYRQFDEAADRTRILVLLSPT